MKEKLKEILITKAFWINVIAALSIAFKEISGIGIDSQMQFNLLLGINLILQGLTGKELRKIKSEKEHFKKHFFNNEEELKELKAENKQIKMDNDSFQLFKLMSDKHISK